MLYPDDGVNDDGYGRIVPYAVLLLKSAFDFSPFPFYFYPHVHSAVCPRTQITLELRGTTHLENPESQASHRLAV